MSALKNTGLWNGEPMSEMSNEQLCGVIEDLVRANHDLQDEHDRLLHKHIRAVRELSRPKSLFERLFGK